MNKIQKNVSLAAMTTFGIGGPARFFQEADAIDELIKAFEFADSSDIDVFILGGGSNLLVADHGIEALVLKVAIFGLEFIDLGKETLITAGAGVNWDSLVAESVKRGLSGIECLSGIPGMVGGTPIQNVGAYGQEVSESIMSVKCLDRSTGNIVEIGNNECQFSYRSSIFNTAETGRYVVLDVTYSLSTRGRPRVAYRDLIEHFKGKDPSLSEVREAVLEIRRSKSMVIDASDPNSRSAGSFFKNPIVTLYELDQLRGMFENLPSFALGEKVKIPAAWLIENAGFKKGFASGNVGISENHSLAIINRGGGTAAEVIGLMKRIQDAVSSKFGLALIPEPIFAGFRSENKVDVPQYQ